MTVLASLVQWLQLKKYQLEVSFSVYIYTPLEKFIFCTSPHSPFPSPLPLPLMHVVTPSGTPIRRKGELTKKTPPGSVLFLLTSLTFIATFLYLPQHIIFLMNRAWFYVHGDSVDVLEMTKEAVQTLAGGDGAAAEAGATAAGTLAGAAAAVSGVAEGATDIVREL